MMEALLIQPKRKQQILTEIDGGISRGWDDLIRAARLQHEIAP